MHGFDNKGTGKTGWAMITWMYRLILCLVVLSFPFQHLAAAQVHLAPKGHLLAAETLVLRLDTRTLATKLASNRSQPVIERCDEHHTQVVQSVVVEPAEKQATLFDLRAHDKDSKTKCSSSAGNCPSAGMLPGALTVQKTAASSIELAPPSMDIFLHGPILDGIDRPPR